MTDSDEDYCYHCGSDCTDYTRCTYCVGSDGVFGPGVSKIATYKERAEALAAALRQIAAYDPPETDYRIHQGMRDIARKALAISQ